MSDHYIIKNASGCPDPTVDKIVKKEKILEKKEKEENDYRIMTKNIKKELDKHGYILEGPINLINSKNGRKRRIY